MHRLTQAGYIEKTRPYALADDWAGLPDDEEAIRDRLWDGKPALVTDAVWCVALLLSLVRNGPQRLAEWAGTAPSGAAKRAIQRLVLDEIVIPPAFRWPTVAGVALVDGWIVPAKVA